MIAMKPFRIITTPEELEALAISSIVCPPRDPQNALRKAWKDLFTRFESTRETDLREAWAGLTMHCKPEAPEIWVLWDAAAKSPAARDKRLEN